MKKRIGKAKQGLASDVSPAKSYVVSGAGVSREFFELIKNIGEATSRAEEETIIDTEARVLKKIFRENISSMSLGKKRDLLMRTLYVHMLGKDASFGYILAINMTQEAALIEKRLGYLIVSLFLLENSNMILLIVNSLRKDLSSTNYLEVCAALGTIATVSSSDTIPALEDLVYPLKDHSNSLVRKKVAAVLYRFYVKMKSDATLDKVEEIQRRLLCDPMPSVMGATLPFFLDIAKNRPERLYDLIPSFANILKQITERRLMVEYDYHGVPSPWMQIHLIRVLAQLGKGSKDRTDDMLEVMGQALKRTMEGVNAASASICLECINAASIIHPNRKLIEMASFATERMLRTSSSNLHFLGISALRKIVKIIPPTHIIKNQDAIMHCLDSDDFSLRINTLYLLVGMANPKNLDIVVEKLLQNVEEMGSRQEVRKDLLRQTAGILQELSPNSEYLVTKMLKLFECGKGDVPEDLKNNSMRLLAEGISEDFNDEEEMNYRKRSVESFAKVIASNKYVSPALMEVSIWFVGEFGYCSPGSIESLIQSLEAAARTLEDDWLRGMAVFALFKLSVQLGRTLESTKVLLRHLSSVGEAETAQRSAEVLRLLEDASFARNVMPKDASCEDVKLGGLERAVEQYAKAQLAAGMADYVPKEERDEEGIEWGKGEAEDLEEKFKLKVEAYEPSGSQRASAELSAVAAPESTPDKPAIQIFSTGPEAIAKPRASPVIQKRKKWGKEGYIKNEKPTETGTHDEYGEYGDEDIPRGGAGTVDQAVAPAASKEKFFSPKPYDEAKIVAVAATPSYTQPKPEKKEAVINPLFSGLVGDTGADRRRTPSKKKEVLVHEPEEDLMMGNSTGEEAQDMLVDFGGVSVEQKSAADEHEDVLEPVEPAPSEPISNKHVDEDILGSGGILDLFGEASVSGAAPLPIIERIPQRSTLHAGMDLPPTLLHSLDSAPFLFTSFKELAVAGDAKVLCNIQKCTNRLAVVFCYSFGTAATHISSSVDKISPQAFNSKVENSPEETLLVGLKSEWKKADEGSNIFQIFTISFDNLEAALKTLPCTVRVRLSFFDAAGTSQFSSFTYPIGIADFLHSASFSMADFEESWAKLQWKKTVDAALAIESDTEDVRMAADELSKTLGIHIIEVMGDEFICSSRTTLPTDAEATSARTLLVHARVSPVNMGEKIIYKFAITMKSDDKSLADVMYKSCLSLKA